jgi:hypothetical protein
MPLNELGVSMSTLQERSAVLQTRLSMLFRNANDLELKLYELNKLRYQAGQAQLSVRKSRRAIYGIRRRLAEGQACTVL